MDMDVIARLARVAGQAAGMEKAALGATGALNSVKGFLGKNWGKLLGGGVAAGGAHNVLREHQLSTAGPSAANPYTWAAPSTEEQAFQHNNENYARMAKPVVGQLQGALDKGDTAGAENYQKQLDTHSMPRNSPWSMGGYNPLSWGFGGWNPYGSHGADYYHRGGTAIQGGLQKKYDQEVNSMGLRDNEWAKMDALKQRLKSTDLMPAQAEGIQAQLSRLQERSRVQPGTENSAAAAMRKRMEDMQMRVRRPAPPVYDNVGWGPGQVPPAMRHNVDPSTRLRDWSQFEAAPKPPQPAGDFSVYRPGQ